MGGFNEAPQIPLRPRLDSADERRRLLRLSTFDFGAEEVGGGGLVASAGTAESPAPIGSGDSDR